jgi:transcriptional regulator with XRE-family HTH domain
MTQQRIDVAALVAALNAQRKALGLSWRRVAQDTGVSPSTLTRMQQGKSPDINTFTALTAWLKMPGEQFTSTESRKTAEPHPLAVLSTVLTAEGGAAGLLRGKKKFSPKAIDAIQELVQAAMRLSKELK